MPLFQGLHEVLLHAEVAPAIAMWHHGFNAPRRGEDMSDEQDAQEIAMLRAEVEILMSERQALLRAAGAAAVFVANLDSETLPEDTYEVADLLAHALNDLPEDTLRDALEAARPPTEENRLAEEAN
jgi:hypothetical protein